MESTWSYGSVVVLEKDAAPDPTWSHGRPVLNYEYEAAAGGANPHWYYEMLKRRNR